MTLRTPSLIVLEASFYPSSVLLRVWLVLSFSLFAAVAEAQSARAPADVAQARELFAGGVVALQAERWAEACEALTQSVALVETAQTYFNLALCSEHLGRLLEQSEHLRAFVRLAGPEVEPQRVETARRTIASLEHRLPRVVLRVSGVTAGASVELNGRVVPPAAWAAPRPLSPGRVTVRATAPGAQPFEWELTVGENETRDIEILLVRAASGVVDWDGRVVEGSAEQTRQALAAAAPNDDTGLAWGLGLSLTALVGVGVGVLVWWFGFESRPLRAYPFEQEVLGGGFRVETLQVAEW